MVWWRVRTCWDGVVGENQLDGVVEGEDQLGWCGGGRR